MRDRGLSMAELFLGNRKCTLAHMSCIGLSIYLLYHTGYMSTVLVEIQCDDHPSTDMLG